MVIIIWNLTGFHVIRAFLSECEFNSSYSQNEIFGPLSKWRSEQQQLVDQVED
jgi:hypothetical protein